MEVSESASPAPANFKKQPSLFCEKCSSCGSLLCVENSSASRSGENVLLAHGLEGSPAIVARLCAFTRGSNIPAPAHPFSVSCLARKFHTQSEFSTRCSSSPEGYRILAGGGAKRNPRKP